MNIKYILLLLCLLCCGAASSAPYRKHLWLTTMWEISPADVPENVLYALQDETYDPSGIEQATVIETPEDVYYSLKLKQANHAVEIKIDALGKIIP